MLVHVPVTLRFAGEVNEHLSFVIDGSKPDFLLDLQRVRFVTPAGLVGLLQMTSTILKAGHSVSIKSPTAQGVQNYLSRMKFDNALKTVGLSLALPSVSANPNSHRLVELTPFDGVDGHDKLSDLLLERATRGLIDGALASRLNGLLYELTHNVVDHSGEPHGFACAQVIQGRIHLAVSDAGHGLRHTLSAGYGPQSDLQAVHLAVQRGVSRHSSNRGVGLFHLVDQVATQRNGYVMVRSGTAAQQWIGSARPPGRNVAELRGTLVCAVIPWEV